MCVILTIQANCPPSDLPRAADLRRMARANPDGLGVAWRRPSGAIVLRRGVPRVRDWISTILSVARTGCPVVAHARIATIGGPWPALTHPWPVYAPDESDRRRRPIVAALAHNGHDAWWSQRLTAVPALAAAAEHDRSHRYGLVSRDTHYPRDPWSDSRAYAVMASTLGLDALLAAPPIGQRLAVLTADALLETGPGWTRYRESSYVRVSNTAWQPRPLRDVDTQTRAMWPAECVAGAPRSADLYDGYGRLWPDRSAAAAAADADADAAAAADADDRLAGWGIDDVTGAIGVTACRRGGVR